MIEPETRTPELRKPGERKPAIRNTFARSLQGRRAGFPSRVAANVVDIGVVAVIYFAMLGVWGIASYILQGGEFTFPSPGPWWTIAIEWTIAALYLFSAYAGTGRTIGKHLMGLRVVTTKGGRVHAPAAFVRTALVITVGIPSLCWAIVSRKNAAAHDIVARTAVAYDWTHE